VVINPFGKELQSFPERSHLPPEPDCKMTADRIFADASAYIEVVIGTSATYLVTTDFIYITLQLHCLKFPNRTL